MAATLPSGVLTDKDKSLVIGRPRMAKVTTADKPTAGSLSPLVKDAAKQAHGKQELAALAIGKDGGNFSRDSDAERLTIRDLRQLGPQFLVLFADLLKEEYGALAPSPAARAERLIDDMQAMLNEFRQFVRSAA